MSPSTSFTTSSLVNFGRGGYNGPAQSSSDDEDSRSFTFTPINYGRGGYNSPAKKSDDDDEAEDGRGGYN